MARELVQVVVSGQERLTQHWRVDSHRDLFPGRCQGGTEEGCYIQDVLLRVTTVEISTTDVKEVRWSVLM